jgi:hypothetical protein
MGSKELFPKEESERLFPHAKGIVNKPQYDVQYFKKGKAIHIRWIERNKRMFSENASVGKHIDEIYGSHFLVRDCQPFILEVVSCEALVVDIPISFIMDRKIEITEMEVSE